MPLKRVKVDKWVDNEYHLYGGALGFEKCVACQRTLEEIQNSKDEPLCDCSKHHPICLKRKEYEQNR